jgi:peptidoglycan/xylan/chitin deacetylase (PgdA/CDA1 family)
MIPVRWPDGKSAAAAFTFDVDAESCVLWNNEAVGARMSVMSHQAYGPLVGVPRILDLLEHHQIASTFFVPGHTADRYPEAIRSIVAAGHEIGHHGYLHEQPTALTLEEEIDVIDRGLAALADVAGVRPIGYRAPMNELSWRTPALLADRGFLYDASLMDSDHPYELAVTPGADRSLVEIPMQWALDDWEQYCFIPDVSGSGLIESPRKAREMWQLEFDGLRRVGACWVLTNHPFLSGRPSRAAELGDLMRYVLDHNDVWVTNLGSIAEHVRTLGLSPRSITPPDVPR